MQRSAPGGDRHDAVLPGVGAREADAGEVAKPPLEAPSSAVVDCEHGRRCGGCPLLALPYGEQIARKRGRVVSAIVRYADLERVRTEPVAPATPFVAYRTRAKVIVGPNGEVGLFARGGGHHVVDIPRCRVVSPVLLEVTNLLREVIKRDRARGGPLAPLPASRPSGTPPPGALRALDLREVVHHGTARVLVTLVVQREVAPPLEHLRAAAEALRRDEPRIAGIGVNYHEGDAPQILGGETLVLAGAASALDEVRTDGGPAHVATYGSFVQAHRGQAARVHGWLVEALGLDARGGADVTAVRCTCHARASKDLPCTCPGAGAAKRVRRPRVLDLYGGSGAIALALAEAGAEVTLVESFAPAVDHVREAATHNRLPVRAEQGDVAVVLRALASKHAGAAPVPREPLFDAVVVNPPRRGLAPEVREQVARLGVARIGYVSCDPDTLARDLDHLQRLGYRAPRLRPLDMIPLTEEVETVAILERGPLPSPAVLYEDETVLVVAKAAHEPTTPQGEYESSLLARTRQLPGAAEATPVHRLDIGTSGLVIFARRPGLVSPWAAALGAEEARKIYVAAVRGGTPPKGTIARELREGTRSYPARTRYRRLLPLGGHSLLRVSPEQGRTHQIRKHLASIGHPILGDDRYGHAPTNRYFAEKNGLDRTFLHCVRVELTHPHTSAKLVLEAPLAGDLRLVVERTSGASALRFLDRRSALGRPSELPDRATRDLLEREPTDAGAPDVMALLARDDDDDERG